MVRREYPLPPEGTPTRESHPLVDDPFEGSVVDVHVDPADAGEHDGHFAGTFRMVIYLVAFPLAGPVLRMSWILAVMRMLAVFVIRPGDAHVTVIEVIVQVLGYLEVAHLEITGAASHVEALEVLVSLEAEPV